MPPAPKGYKGIPLYRENALVMPLRPSKQGHANQSLKSSIQFLIKILMSHPNDQTTPMPTLREIIAARAFLQTRRVKLTPQKELLGTHMALQALGKSRSLDNRDWLKKYWQGEVLWRGFKSYHAYSPELIHAIGVVTRRIICGKP